jgi:ABC-type transport system involved in multi-copper enzyme maturation permease subunit
MLHALQSELFRLRKRPQTWIMPFLAFGFIGVFYLVLTLIHRFGSATDRADMRTAVRVDNIFENGVQVFGFFGGILVVIVSSSLIGSEFGWNTLRPLVSRASSRSGLLAAKWVTVAIYTVLMVIVGVVASLALATVASMVTGVDIDLPSRLWDDYLLGTVRWMGAMLPYAALAFAAALVTRSNAAGIAIGIGWSFVEPLLFQLFGLISDVFETVQEYGIAWNVQQLGTMPTQASSFSDPVPAGQVWQSAGVLAVYVAAFVAVSFVVFNRRDITSG